MARDMKVPRACAASDGWCHSLEIRNMLDWVPLVFVTFKVLAFGTGMFFAIKWHHDREQKGKEMETRAVLLATGKVAAVFLLSLLVLGLFTFFLCRRLGLDLTLP